MTILKILTYPDPFLKTTAKTVTVFDQNLQKTIDDMVETMYESKGIGLAAIQVGVNKRLFVIDVEYKGEDSDTEKNPLVVINPEIIETNDSISYEEACLSVPDYRAEVKRHKQITLKYNTFEGEEKNLKADDLFSICIQHELDHLNGTLFIDRLSLLKRKMIQKKLKKQAAKS